MVLSEQTKRLIWHYRFIARLLVVILVAHIDEGNTDYTLKQKEVFKRALASLNNQIVRPDKIIIVYSGQRPDIETKINHIVLNKNKSQFADYIDLAVEHCKRGDIISFLHFTNYYVPNKLKIVKEHFNNGVDILVHRSNDILYFPNPFTIDISDDDFVATNLTEVSHSHITYGINVSIRYSEFIKCNNDIDFINMVKSTWDAGFEIYIKTKYKDLLILREYLTYNRQYLNIGGNILNY